MEVKSFFKDVYEVVKLIPPGRVTTYGAIADYLGTRSSARMVGWAMNGAVSTDGVPAHRVVNRNGVLTGKSHFPSDEFMQKKLESEGIEIRNDTIIGFEKVFWDPKRELGF